MRTREECRIGTQKTRQSISGLTTGSNGGRSAVMAGGWNLPTNPSFYRGNVFTHARNDRIQVVSSVSSRRARNRSTSANGRNGNAGLTVCRA